MSSEHLAPEILVQKHCSRLLLSKQLAHNINRGAQQHDGTSGTEQVEQCERPAGELDQEEDGDAGAECVCFGHVGRYTEQVWCCA